MQLQRNVSQPTSRRRVVRRLVTGGALVTWLLSGCLTAGGGQPLPVSAGIPSCPDAQVYCDATAQLYAWLLDGDVDQVFAHSRPTDVVCARSMGTSALGSACNGAAEGEHRPGYLIGGSGGNDAIAGYGTAAAYRSFLQEIMSAIHQLVSEPTLQGSFGALGFAVADQGRCYLAFIGTGTSPENGQQGRLLLVVAAQVDVPGGALQFTGIFLAELPDGAAPIGPEGLNTPNFVYWSPPPRT